MNSAGGNYQCKVQAVKPVQAAALGLVALIWLAKLGATTQCTAPEVLRGTSSVKLQADTCNSAFMQQDQG